MYLEKPKRLIIYNGFSTSWPSCFEVSRPQLSPALKLAGQRDDVTCAWVHISISLYHQMIYSLVVSSQSNINDLCRWCWDCTVRKVVCFWRTGNDDQKEWMGSSNFFQNIWSLSQNQIPKANAHKNNMFTSNWWLSISSDDQEVLWNNREPMETNPRKNEWKTANTVQWRTVRGFSTRLSGIGGQTVRRSLDRKHSD